MTTIILFLTWFVCLKVGCLLIGLAIAVLGYSLVMLIWVVRTLKAGIKKCIAER